uniref:Glycosyltransferase RgtA/B/C/D-like domain-containing protein n=1 Tax=Solibacter usitatus (strain Ellin6076) TaxID=234267 RepID=Q029U1_SOLUE
MKTNSVRKQSPPGRCPAPTPAAHQTLPRSQPVPSAAIEPRSVRPWLRRLPTALLWTSVALMVAFCAGRLAAIRLLPLDAPGTLHALLWPYFSSLIASYNWYADDFAPLWISRGLITLFLPFALVLLCVLPVWRPLRRVLRSRALFWASVASCLLYWRFPLLLGGASNVDEAEFTVSATKLLVDPVFFRSTNVGTSGPLNILPLLVPTLFGFSPDYATARVIALVIIFLTLFFLHRALSGIGSDELARAAILPALGFFSLATFPDFVTYSAELVPMLLTALAVLACVRAIREPARSARPLLALGFLVSAAFFSKMQSVPILAAAAAFAAIAVCLSRQVRPWWRPAVLLAAGFVPLQLLNLLVAVAAGVTREASAGYVTGNAHLSRSTSNFFAGAPALAATIAATAEMQFLILILLSLAAVTLYAALRGDRERETLRFPGSALVAAAVYTGLFQFQVLFHSPALRTLCAVIALVAFGIVAYLAFTSDRAFGVFSLVLPAAAIFSIYLSPQKFPHYMELLIVPLSTLIGWFLIRQGPRRSTVFVAIALFLTAEIPLLDHVRPNVSAAHETMAFPGGSLIRSLTHPGSTIVVWGWRPELYLSAGRIPATREANVFYTGKDADPHFAERVLGRFKRARPELIVDALNVSCCYVNDRKRFGFEAVPEVNSYLQANYVLVAEKYSEKFYLRRDLPK